MLMIKSEMKINALDIVIFQEYFGYPLFLVEVNSRMMVCQFDFDVPVADLAFHLNDHSRTCVLIYSEGLSKIFF